ncbi:hypothetical protein SNEBB_001863, partial [Seison nebaliae]
MASLGNTTEKYDRSILYCGVPLYMIDKSELELITDELEIDRVGNLAKWELISLILSNLNCSVELPTKFKRPLNIDMTSIGNMIREEVVKQVQLQKHSMDGEVAQGVATKQKIYVPFQQTNIDNYIVGNNFLVWKKEFEQKMIILNVPKSNYPKLLSAYLPSSISSYLKYMGEKSDKKKANSYSYEELVKMIIEKEDGVSLERKFFTSKREKEQSVTEFYYELKEVSDIIHHEESAEFQQKLLCQQFRENINDRKLEKVLKKSKSNNIHQLVDRALEVEEEEKIDKKYQNIEQSVNFVNSKNSFNERNKYYEHRNGNRENYPKSEGNSNYRNSNNYYDQNRKKRNDWQRKPRKSWVVRDKRFNNESEENRNSDNNVSMDYLNEQIESLRDEMKKMKMNTLLIDKNDSDNDSINRIEQQNQKIVTLRNQSENYDKVEVNRNLNVKLFGNDGLRYFKIRIGNTDVKAMVDSGANVSCINKSEVERIFNKKLKENKKTRITTADGSEMRVFGAIICNCEINNLFVLIKFKIINNLAAPIIIGDDILQKLIIDGQNKEIRGSIRSNGIINAIRIGENRISDVVRRKLSEQKLTNYHTECLCKILEANKSIIGSDDNIGCYQKK